MEEMRRGLMEIRAGDCNRQFVFLSNIIPLPDHAIFRMNLRFIGCCLARNGACHARFSVYYLL